MWLQASSVKMWHRINKYPLVLRTDGVAEECTHKVMDEYYGQNGQSRASYVLQTNLYGTNCVIQVIGVLLTAELGPTQTTGSFTLAVITRENTYDGFNKKGTVPVRLGLPREISHAREERCVVSVSTTSDNTITEKRVIVVLFVIVLAADCGRHIARSREKNSVD